MTVTLRRWLILLAVLGMTVALVSCSGDDDSSTPGDGSSPRTGVVKSTVGETIELGPVRLLVSVLGSTVSPSLPDSVLSDKPPSPVSDERVFYQAFVRVENTGTQPVRVDPRDFALMAGGDLIRIDETRSGPVPRSLLQSTSVYLVLTFPGPPGLRPALLYRPPWYEGDIRVEGTQTPVGGT